MASVVAVFVWMIGFAAALDRSLSVAGDKQKVIVIRPGATAESNSVIPIEDCAKLNQIAALARDPKSGEPLISPELVAQVRLSRLRDGGRTQANVAVRGVTERAFDVHRNVKRLGASFSTGTPEVIVGLATAKQFAGLKIGDLVRLGYSGDRGYKVVGYFSAGGGPTESEIWGYLPSLQSSYNRTLYSSVAMRLDPRTNAAEAIAQIRGPAIQLEADTEAEYWKKQTGIIQFYLTLSYSLIGIMCLAAVFSIANTMFSSVAGRAREIAMFRAMGYSPPAILTGFLLEAVLLSLLGGLLGSAMGAAWLAIMGNQKDMFGASTFTTLAFEIRVSAWIVAIALVTAAVVGVLGALYPAGRAALAPVVSTLREP